MHRQTRLHIRSAQPTRIVSAPLDRQAEQSQREPRARAEKILMSLDILSDKTLQPWAREPVKVANQNEPQKGLLPS